jgi:mRNA interferase HigB
VAFNVISKPKLKEFWERHAHSQEALEAWYRLVSRGDFANFAEVKQVFGSADYVQPDYIVFDIKGNHYRIVTRVNFTFKTFWIKHVFTHEEYNRWKP